MSNLFNAINKYFPNSNNYIINKNAIIFTNNDKRYVVKHNRNNIVEKQRYLKSRGFDNIPEIIFNNKELISLIFYRYLYFKNYLNYFSKKVLE